MTHQCFLSTRSLYLVVWSVMDGEQGIENLGLWLHNIQVDIHVHACTYIHAYIHTYIHICTCEVIDGLLQNYNIIVGQPLL